jgi:hypothetical protein
LKDRVEFGRKFTIIVGSYGLPIQEVAQSFNHPEGGILPPGSAACIIPLPIGMMDDHDC